MDMVELKCNRFVELIQMMPDVCSLRKDIKSLHYFLSLSHGDIPANKTGLKAKLTSSENPQVFDLELVTNLHKILVSCGGSIQVSQLYGKHLEIIGTFFNLGKYVFNSVTSLFRGISGHHGFFFGGSKLTSKVNFTALTRIPGNELESGWVRVTGVRGDHHVRVVTLSEDRKVWDQELDMEEFYVSKKIGKRLSTEEIFPHQAVAAFDSDTRIYRARVLSLHEDLVKILYVDEGKTSLVKQNSLFHLENEFCVLPEQVIDVKTTVEVTPTFNTLDQPHGIAWLYKDEERTELLLKPSSIERKFSTISKPSKNTEVTNALKTIIIKKWISNAI